MIHGLSQRILKILNILIQQGVIYKFYYCMVVDINNKFKIIIILSCVKYLALMRIYGILLHWTILTRPRK